MILLHFNGDGIIVIRGVRYLSDRLLEAVCAEVRFLRLLLARRLGPTIATIQLCNLK
jgi:hypothetical protein